MEVTNMSIEEKVGQLFIVSFNETKPTGEMIHLISAYKVGGFCLDRNNFRNPKQVHTLTKNLQRYTDKKLPLFFSTLQEGGEMNSFIEGVTQAPCQSILGKVNNRLYTKQMAEIVAEELRALGINMNVSPAIVKPETSEENSYHGSADLNARHAIATIEGYQKKNISAVAKYFPGTKDIPVERLLTEMYDDPRSALYPFFLAIQKEVDAILVSESMLPTSKTEEPALFNRSILYTLLREELKYDGLLISEYKQPTFSEETVRSVVLNIQSGIDLLFLPEPYKMQIAIINAVIEAVRTGEIPEERLDESVKRILTVKEKRKIGKAEPFNRDLFAKRRSLEFVEKLEQQAASTTI